MVYDLQKANFWKRISAFLFDFILLVILTVGAATLLSAILGYDAHAETLNKCYAEYEEEYGISFNIGYEDYQKFTDEEKKNYEAANEALINNDSFIYSRYMVINLSFIIIVFSLLISHLVLEFAVPMLLKNGQTIGKKVFGIAVMRVDGVKISGPMLFTRSILGKFVVESALPILFFLMIFFGIVAPLIGLIAIGAIVITNIVMTLFSKTNSPIHDLIAGTVAVDMASQLIFDTPEALLEYKQKVHAETVGNSEYF